MASSGPSLHIRLFGRFQVAAGGVAVDDARWARRQSKTVLKLLALAPRHHLHREVLMEAIWPEAGRDSAVNSLNKAIHGARRALEPELAQGGDSSYLATRDGLVLLQAPGGVGVDAAEFERRAEAALAGDDPAACEAALACYGGDLLPEDRYEQWLEQHRARLAALRLELSRRLAAVYEAAGDWGAAARHVEAALSVDPFDEAAVRRLLTSLARAGQRGRALARYRELAARLRDEIGAEPEAETRVLCERIASGDLGPAASAQPAVAAGAPERPRRGPASNLPRRGTEFVGRRRELALVGEQVRASRLVTLAGIGGIGKTRLSLRVGEEALSELDGRVWLVELAGVSGAGSVAGAIVGVLGAGDPRGRPLGAALSAAIGDDPALLILDNCEHVVDEAAAAVAELVGACPGLRVLASSREPLGLEGEVVWRVPPLGLPEEGAARSAAELARHEATRLFVERARLRSSGYEPSDESAPAVAALCRSLGGIPLAIELAAASLGVLTVEQLVDRIGDVLQLASGAPRSAAPRHKTLRAVMDWSYDLLSEAERVLLARISVFAGSFTLEAAEAVCGGAGLARADVLPLLARLVDTSLVDARDVGAAVRYSLLGTVRLYAGEKLEKRGEAERVGWAYAEWLASFAESVAPQLAGHDQGGALRRLDAERDNLLAAIRWAVSRLEADPLPGLRLCSALWIWFQRPDLDAGRAWVEAALGTAGEQPPELRANLLHGLSHFLRVQGDFPRAVAALEESVALWREIGDRAGLARALQALGTLVAETGDYDGGAILHREAALLCRELGDALGNAKSAFALGVQSVFYGEFEGAAQWFEEALELYRKVGSEGGVLVTLHNLGEVALLTGDLERAERLVDESLEVSRARADKVIAPQSMRLHGDIARERGERDRALGWYRRAAALHLEQGDRPGLALLLESAAVLECGEGHAVAALRLVGCASALRERLGLAVHPFARAILDRCVADATTLVGPTAAAEALAGGRDTPVETALAALL